nr:prepilin-type N-terminal cleavage/methylation domain-containing protein [uncultured Desulfuromonas sp.]
MHRQRGFTLLELIVVIAVVIILASVVLPKFLRLMHQAEVSAVQGMVGQMRSALSLQMSRGLYRGDDLAAWACDGSRPLYPMHDLLLDPPENYLGVLSASDRRGCWYDDKNSHELVYVLRHDELVQGFSATPAKLRWQIRVIRGPLSAGEPDTLIGLVLQSSSATHWITD